MWIKDTMGGVGAHEAIPRELNVAQKAIADRGDGGNVPRLANVVPEETPQCRDATGERAFRDRGIAPDGGEELILGNHSVGMVKQELQDLKDLWFEWQHRSRLRDREIPLVHLDIGEAKGAVSVFHMRSRKFFTVSEE
jgi:hypothetical protein